ncbi:MAG: ABC transporter ATP-binding protein [Gemmatimonadota bacterium]
MSSAVAVEVEGLVRVFGKVEAIGGLGFEVSPGELFGVVGPDGAGKTTLLRVLAGVLRPSAGDARLFGTSVARDPEGVKATLAYMSQRFGLYTDLTVAENIRFYADLYGVPWSDRPARLERLYAFSGLGPFQGRLAGALSGGMRQKLSLSCALIHQPRLLLLDEPTFGVDPISRRDLWLIIHEMVAAGTTVIASTSYLDEAERCDRVLLLHEGRRLGLDTPAALQRQLDGRVFAVEGPDMVALRRVLGAAPGVRTVARYGRTLHVTTEPSGAEAVAALAGSTGSGASTIRPVPPSLEDVFVTLMTGAASG